MSINRLGNNIRALRNAFGETQEMLGEAIHAEKNTISNYEKGNRAPDRETIVLIAQHYSVSVEELLHSDLSGISKITIDRFAFWKNVDIVFPIFSVEESHADNSFRRAYKAHSNLLTQMKKNSFEGFEELDKIIEGYWDAYENENIKYEAAANFIGIWYLLVALFQLSSLALTRRTAAVVQLANKDSEVRRIVDEPDPDFEKDAKEALSDMNDPEVNEKIEEMLNMLKHSTDWSDLADYYLALRYVYNLVDNDLNPEFSQRIGVEMMNSFVSVNNLYAARFIVFSYEAVGGKFTD